MSVVNQFSSSREYQERIDNEAKKRGMSRAEFIKFCVEKELSKHS